MLFVKINMPTRLNMDGYESVSVAEKKANKQEYI